MRSYNEDPGVPPSHSKRYVDLELAWAETIPDDEWSRDAEEEYRQYKKECNDLPDGQRESRKKRSIGKQLSVLRRDVSTSYVPKFPLIYMPAPWCRLGGLGLYVSAQRRTSAVESRAPTGAAMICGNRMHGNRRERPLLHLLCCRRRDRAVRAIGHTLHSSQFPGTSGYRRLDCRARTLGTTRYGSIPTRLHLSCRISRSKSCGRHF